MDAAKERLRRRLPGRPAGRRQAMQSILTQFAREHPGVELRLTDSGELFSTTKEDTAELAAEDAFFADYAEYRPPRSWSRPTWARWTSGCGCTPGSASCWRRAGLTAARASTSRTYPRKKKRRAPPARSAAVSCRPRAWSSLTATTRRSNWSCSVTRLDRQFGGHLAPRPGQPERRAPAHRRRRPRQGPRGGDQTRAEQRQASLVRPTRRHGRRAAPSSRQGILRRAGPDPGGSAGANSGLSPTLPKS